MIAAPVFAMRKPASNSRIFKIIRSARRHDSLSVHEPCASLLTNWFSVLPVFGVAVSGFLDF
jgi:hypothetical protein